MNLFYLGQLVKLGLRHRRLAFQKVHERLHIRQVRQSVNESNNGVLPDPLTVGVNLTFKCNLRCKMCGQYGQRGIHRAAKKEFLRQRLSIEELRSIIDEVSPHKPDIFVWGGEPLLHPGFLEFVEYVKSRGLICTVNTNATLLARVADDLVKFGLDGIDVSLDGPEDLNDEIRGVSGATQAALDGVRAVTKAKARLKTNSPMLKVICTISESNQDRAREFIEFLEDLRLFDLICVQLGWFTSEDIGKRQETVYQRLFSCESPSWRGFVDACGNTDSNVVREVVTWCRSRRGSPPVVIFPNLNESDIITYYGRPDQPIGKDMCLAPWLSADIRPNGDVTFCPDFPDYIVGNVREESFKSIWRGPRAMRFREVLMDHRLFPICSRCCGLYAYGATVAKSTSYY